MSGAKPVDTLIQQNHNLALAKGYVIRDPMKYRRLVGRLVYLTITWPDLVYAVHLLSQFVHESRKEHWEAALRLVRYLKKNLGKGIVTDSMSDLQHNGYTDSDWASCPLITRSLSGYFVALGNTSVSLKTKMQGTKARSMAEAEYRAMATLTSITYK
ncbi:putative mitochondrial protein AtMg00240 [Silene latifolia]|uniref:putative mitochondrial protein AtMg00240 n=1 Tax=Silene latifolia TaxID=37657 RepID=UPI003D76E93D